MTAPNPGLPITLQLHVVDSNGNELPPNQIPSSQVGGKGKTSLTFQRIELWVTPGDYWNGELHLFLRAI